MLRKLVGTQHRIPFKEVVLQRTAEGKPVLPNRIGNLFPNFNFNLSHSDHVVAAGCEPCWVIGVDVMEKVLRRPEPLHEFFSTMRTCFTDYEWQVIEFSNLEDEQLRMFFVHWTLKESYIKAVGIGLGFELKRAQFTLSLDQLSATIQIDGILQKNWHFEIHDFTSQVVAVAYGPVFHTTPNYRKFLSNSEVTVGVEFPARAQFQELSYEQVVEDCF